MSSAFSAQYYCEECKISFQTTEQLANHKKKFCVDSVYSDPARLRQELASSACRPLPSHSLSENASVEDVRAVLDGSASTSQVSISDFRSRMKKDEEEMKRLMRIFEKDLKVQEADKQKSIREQQQELVLMQREKEKKLAVLLDELESRKEQDMVVRLEMERTRKAVDKLDREKLAVLESEKKEELKKLQRERERLFRRENDIQAEIDGLEQRILNREKERTEAQEKLQSFMSHGAQVRGDREELVRQQAIQETRHKFENQALQQEREKIQQRMIAIQPSADRSKLKTPNAADELDRFVEDLKQRSAQSEKRLGELKNERYGADASHAAAAADARPSSDEKDLEALDLFLAEHKQRKAEHCAESLSSLDVVAPHDRSVPRPRSAPQFDANPDVRQLHAELDSLRNLYRQSGGSDPAILNEIQEVEKLLFGSAVSSASSMPPPAASAPLSARPHYGQPPARSPNANQFKDPMLEALEKQIQETQELLKKQDAENEKLRDHVQRLSDLKSRRPGSRDPIHGRHGRTPYGLERPSGRPRDPSKHGNQRENPGAGEEYHDSNSQRSRSPSPVAAATPRRNDQKSNHLDELREEHVKELARIDFEMEKLAKESKLQKLKDEMEREKRESAKREEHERWMEEQKRAVMEAKLKKQLAQEGLSDTSQSSRTSQYVPEQGFGLFFDYCTGLPPNNTQVSVAYAAFNGSVQRAKVRALPTFDAESDGVSHLRCIFATVRRFAKVPAAADFKFMFELQSVLAPAASPDSPAKTQPIGWTIVEPFERDGTLVTGRLKLPVFYQPVNSAIDAATLNSQGKRIPNLCFFVRIAVASQVDEQAKIGVNPDISLGEYRFPAAYSAEPVRSLPDAKSTKREEPEEKESKKNEVEPSKKESVPSVPPAAAPPVVPQTPEKKKLEEESVDTLDSEPGSAPAPALPDPAATLRSSVYFKSLALRGMDLSGASVVRVRGIVYTAGKPLVRDEAASGTNKYFIADTDATSISSVDFLALGSTGGLLDVPIGPATVLVFQVLCNKDVFIAYSFVDLEKFVDGVVVLELNGRPMRVPGSGPTGADMVDILRDPPVKVGLSNAKLEVALKRTPIGASEYLVEVPIIDAVSETDEAADVADVEKPASTRQWSRDDGIDVYIDGARNLPLNVTISKVTIGTFNVAGKSVGKSASGCCAVGGSAISPTFGTKLEIRDLKGLDSTCTIHVQLEAIDKYDVERCIVGHSLLNLFIDNGTEKQPISAVFTDVRLNEGGFEVCLHQHSLLNSAKVTASALDDVPKVCCATVLLRVLKAPRNGKKILGLTDVKRDKWQETGVWIPATRYSPKIYGQSLCVLSDTEKAIMKQRSSVPDALVRDVASSVLRSPPTSDEKLDKLISDVFRNRASSNEKALDYSYIASYDPAYGFSVSVDAGMNMPQKEAVVKVVYSVCPPGHFYSPMRLSHGVKLTMKNDYESDARCPEWLDGLQEFKNIPRHRNLCVVLEVFSTVRYLDPPPIQSLGFALCPILADDGNHVRCGTLKVPVFLGRVPDGLIDQLKDDSKSFDDVVAENLSSQKFKFMNCASLFVRIEDGHLKGTYGQPLSCVRYDDIPRSMMEQFAKQGSGKKQAAVRPRKMSDDEFNNLLNVAFSRYVGLDIMS
eukprot:ANDGO_03115.mRNA.1 hypothetical protein AMSG_06425